MEQSWSLQEAITYFKRQGAPGQQEALVALLREVQSEYGDVIPDAALVEIASAYDLKESYLCAIIKRYPSLRTAAAPHRLEICGGPNCARQDSARLMAWIENTYRVKPGGISKAGKFSYRVCGCLKHCGRGPNVKWDGNVYEHADETLLRSLIKP